MGRDIHLHVEIKVKGQWLHYSRPYIERDYNLFARMAPMYFVVEKEAIAEERGIPTDATETTRYCYKYDENDAHTASYLNLEEIKRLEEWSTKHYENNRPFRGFTSMLGYLFGNTFGGLREYPEDYPYDLEDARIVFWFLG